MIYNANALSTDPATGNVTAAYWSVEHGGRRRSGIVTIASLPPFVDEAAAILAAQTALGPSFIAALEAEVSVVEPPLPPLTTPSGATPEPSNPPPVFEPPPAPPVVVPAPLPPPGF